MCMVSNIGDGFKDQFPYEWPKFVPHTYSPEAVTRSEFEALKREMEELKKLLQAAKRFDDKTGQPHCEIEDKVDLIKRIAQIVGVDLGDVFEQPKSKPHPQRKKRK